MASTAAAVAADGSVATLKPGSPTEIVEGAAANERNEQQALLAGLLAPTPRISQVYLYDARGSELYEEIVRAPEYYLPDTESVLLAAHAAEIVAPSTAAPLASQAIIELGAGAGERTLALLRAALPLADATAYVPVDVSAAALDACAASTRAALAGAARPPRVAPLVGRFEEKLPEAARVADGPRLFLFLGSSLGNYDDAEIGAIFRLVRACMRDGGGSGDRFVIGVDTPHSPRKPARVIHAAYNDAAGATAAFTLNALAHVNRVAGVDFDWEGGWRHVAEYDAALRAIVTHVEAVGPQEVRTTADGALLRRWADGDRIFVEQSRKFDKPTIARLATAAGLALGRTWAADADAYLLIELVPAPPPPTTTTAPAVATAEAADAVPSVRQRDEAFVGLAAARGGEVPAEGADLYGTLLEKRWRAPLPWLRDALRSAHATLLAVAPAGVLPRQPGLNPIEWTLGHVAFTFESIVGDVLRRRRVEPRPSAAAEAWELYDSMRVTNGERWEMEAAAELPDARPYLAAVHSLCEEEATRATAGGDDGTVDPVVTYLVCYALIHELWHTEDLVHTRHCHALPFPPAALAADASAAAPPPPPLSAAAAAERYGGAADAHDVAVPGGTFLLGARRDDGGFVHPRIVLDSDKWEHPVHLRPFRISAHCVTVAQYAQFVAAGGYEKRELWSREGRRWLAQGGGANGAPWTWVREEGGETGGGGGEAALAGWRLRWFETELPLVEVAGWPVCHVSWHEAEAYCRWAKRRLPTEAEWEAACCGVRNAQSGGLAPRKGRTYAWGDAAPDASLANGGLRRGVLLPVDALPAGASEWGCHQMIGNVWEWTATTFYPFPGYVVDYPYREQSAPWFGFTKVARGGCFATPDFVLRGEYRSFYDPAARRELAVGFRTCALDDDEAAAAVAEAAAAARGGGDGRVCRRGDGSCDEFC